MISPGHRSDIFKNMLVEELLKIKDKYWKAKYMLQRREVPNVIKTLFEYILNLNHTGEGHIRTQSFLKLDGWGQEGRV